MKANNLTISIPTGRCKYNCPYCISNMTYPVAENPTRFIRNLIKTKKFAERVGVTHILITGKAEPTQNLKMINNVKNTFKDWPIEIQTKFSENIDITIFKGFDIIALSIDHPNDFLSPLWDKLKETGILLRASIIHNKRFTTWNLNDFIKTCHNNKIDQLTIRKPTVPKNRSGSIKSQETADWIIDHSDYAAYNALNKDLDELIKINNAKFIRDMGFGARIYDIEGVAYTHFDYCLESQNGDILRSLIYQSNGHMYTTWDSPGSKLF